MDKNNSENAVENEKLKKVEKKPSRKNFVKIIICLIIFLLVGVGVNSYLKYTREKQRKLALEEERRLEEAERERERQLIEARKKEFERLLAEMRKYFTQGNYTKVRELAKEALILAKEYNLPTDEIYALLHKIDSQTFLAKLRELQSLSEDIFQYLYVRTEILKIPAWSELRQLRTSVLNTTYKNEYKVSLILSHQQAKESQKGVLPKYNYLSSKEFLEKGISVREKYHLDVSEEESVIMDIHNNLFFASKKLQKETIPSSLY